jgi:hypothetical protein
MVIDNRVTNLAGGYGCLRASHADREQVIDVLKAAFVQGRLTKDEFDLRVGQAFASRTYMELADLTADIPAGLIGAQPGKPSGARARRAAAWGAYGIILPALFAVAIVPGPTTVRAAITTTAVVYLFFWVCGVSMMLVARPQKRFRGQLPPGLAASLSGPVYLFGILPAYRVRREPAVRCRKGAR